MGEFLARNAEALVRSIGVHLFYTLVSVAIGFVLGLGLGILLSRFPRQARFILPLLSLFNTIPGVVFIGLLFLVLHVQPATVLIALSIYAMFPVLKNTFTGLLGVDAQYKEAAQGCGMSPAQQLLRVELPLAMPTIIGGLRMSMVYTVSWAGRHDRPGRPGHLHLPGRAVQQQRPDPAGRRPSRPAGLPPGRAHRPAPEACGAQGTAEGGR